MPRARPLVVFLLPLAASPSACSSDAGGTNLELNDTDSEGGDSNNGGDSDTSGAPAPWNALVLSEPEILTDGSVNNKAGWQGKLLRGNDGTLYYAYLKEAGNAATCDIANFAGDEAPGINYELRVAVRPPGGTWTFESVPLQNVGGAAHPYLSTRYGLSGVMNNQDQPVLAFAGGGPGLFTCASSDLVIATRTGAGVWTFDVPVTDGAACCAECAPDCNAGSDVGAWAALARDAAGSLSAAYCDYHNNSVQDGMDERGLELWEESGGVSGIAPYAGMGAFADMVILGASPNGAYTGPLVVYVAFNGGGLFAARRTGSAGDSSDWQKTQLHSGLFGERVDVAVAPDGTVGVVAQLRNTNGDGDLLYYRSTDNGDTWGGSFPIPELVGGTSLNDGYNPALTFDGQSRAVVTYRVCGTQPGACNNSSDGLRLAVRDDAGEWWRFNVDFNPQTQSGSYSQVVLDPATDAPTIVLQDQTRGVSLVVEGAFQ